MPKPNVVFLAPPLLVLSSLLKLLCLSLSFFASAGVASAGGGELMRKVNAVPNEYIVVLDDSIPRDVTPNVAMELALVHRGRLLGGVTQAGVKAFGVELSEAAAIDLSRDSRVRQVEENSYVQLANHGLQEFPNDDWWHLDRTDNRIPIYSYKAYGYHYTGSNVRAYVLDSGIQASHREFDLDGNPATPGSRVVAGGDFYYEGSGITPDNPCGGYTDNYPGGHGTSVGSVLGGTYTGVAKGVTLVAVKTHNCNGIGTELGVVYATSWVLQDMQGRPGRAVVNLSWYIPLPNNSLCDGQPCIPAFESNVATLVQNNIPVIVSANNLNNGSCNTSPQRMGYGNESGFPSTYRTITVGGTNISDGRYRCSDPPNPDCSQSGNQGSSFGPCVSIYAPGHNLRQLAHIAGFSSYRDPAQTVQIMGTSFSAPVVSGLAARLLHQFPTITAVQVWNEIYARANILASNFDGDGVPANDRLAYLSVND